MLRLSCIIYYWCLDWSDKAHWASTYNKWHFEHAAWQTDDWWHQREPVLDYVNTLLTGFSMIFSSKFKTWKAIIGLSKSPQPSKKSVSKLITGGKRPRSHWIMLLLRSIIVTHKVYSPQGWIHLCACFSCFDSCVQTELMKRGPALWV